MLISELIPILKKAQEKHGDLQVYCEDSRRCEL